MEYSMNYLINLYNDCDTFSLTLSKTISTITKPEKEKLLSKAILEEKEFLKTYYDQISKEELKKYKLPEYESLFNDVLFEVENFYSELRDKDFNKLIFKKKSPFICDHVGKSTKYSKPQNFIWHLYHNIQHVLMSIDELNKMEILEEFDYDGLNLEENSYLKNNVSRFEYTYNTHCTSGPLQLVYYFRLNEETKKWLLNFKDDYDLENSILQDLAFYKNNELKFSSCTHEAFNSLNYIKND